MSSTIAMRVDLDCEKCHKKIRNALCKIQDKVSIRTITYDDKSKTVTISGPFDAEEVADRLTSAAGKVITDMHVAGWGGGQKHAFNAPAAKAGKADGHSLFGFGGGGHKHHQDKGHGGGGGGGHKHQDKGHGGGGSNKQQEIKVHGGAGKQQETKQGHHGGGEEARQLRLRRHVGRRRPAAPRARAPRRRQAQDRHHHQRPRRGAAQRPAHRAVHVHGGGGAHADAGGPGGDDDGAAATPAAAQRHGHAVHLAGAARRARVGLQRPLAVRRRVSRRRRVLRRRSRCAGVRRLRRSGVRVRVRQGPVRGAAAVLRGRAQRRVQHHVTSS